MTNPRHVHWTRSGTVARLWLDRPEHRNALTPSSLEQIAQACLEIAGCEDLRVVHLQGRGSSFSVGFDLMAMSTLFRPPDLVPDADAVRSVGQLGAAAVEALCSLPQATVASLQGHVVGGGLLLAAACDFRVCSDDASFCLPEINLGLPMTWGGVGLLQQKLGPEWARMALLTGESWRAVDCTSPGFVTRCGPKDEVSQLAEALIKKLDSKPPWALKTLVTQLRPNLDRDRKEELDAFVAAVSHPDFLPNAQAYLSRLGTQSG